MCSHEALQLYLTAFLIPCLTVASLFNSAFHSLCMLTALVLSVVLVLRCIQATRQLTDTVLTIVSASISQVNLSVVPS